MSNSINHGAQSETKGLLKAQRVVNTNEDDSDLESDHDSQGLRNAPRSDFMVRQLQHNDDEDQATSTAIVVQKPLQTVGSPSTQPPVIKVHKKEEATWSSLPKKSQLAVLTLARLSEPLSQTSLAAYIFYQLRSFNPSLPDSTITSQGGILTAAFAGSQFLTAVWWGRIADSPRVGRKKVILIGLAGTAMSMVGIGFSKSFAQALVFRMLAGVLNGNVGVMRTMIGEMIQERKFQSRAFLLLPMCFNIGVVIGPLLGGFLADPIKSFPSTFGPGSAIGGKDGVKWMTAFPYALPNIFSAVIIFSAAMGIVFGLDETHQSLRHRPDWGRRCGRYLAKLASRKKDGYKYERLENEDETELQATPVHASAPSQTDPEHQSRTKDHDRSNEASTSTKPRSGFRSILTRNILLTLLAHFLLAMHLSTFNTLVFLFLPTPRAQNQAHSFTLRFSGGLGLSTADLGMATAIIGIIGFPMQILLYPRINAKLGTLKAYRCFLPFSALAYALLPFLVLLPHGGSGSDSSSGSGSDNNPEQKQGWMVWTALTFVLFLQVVSRTFAIPSTVILANNSAPSPAVLGTVHGIAQTVSSAARMLGPSIGGWGLGMGLRVNCVGAAWWGIASVVVLNELVIWTIWEGDGQGGRLES